jgi:hypothetical protein
MGEIVVVVPVVGDIVRPVDVVEGAASDGDIGVARLITECTWGAPPANPPRLWAHEGLAASAQQRAKLEIMVVRTIVDMADLLPLPPEGDVAAEAQTAKCCR